MPATPGTARACALALAGLGLTVSGLTAPTAHAETTSGTTSRTGAATSTTSTSASSTTTTERRRLTARQRVNRRVGAARSIALHQRGDAYAYGAAGPHRFDCSGLIYFSYRRAGFKVPRTSGAQAAHTRRIAKSAMRPGDLMFFHGSGGVYHASVFLGWRHGRAQMVHAPGSGQRVRIASAWTSQWFGGTLRRR